MQLLSIQKSISLVALLLLANNGQAATIPLPPANTNPIFNYFTDFNWSNSTEPTNQTFSIDVNEPARVHVTDLNYQGKGFSVYDNDKLVGETATVITKENPYGVEEYNYRQGFFNLDNGHHVITVQLNDPAEKGTGVIRMIPGWNKESTVIVPTNVNTESNNTTVLNNTSTSISNSTIIGSEDQNPEEQVNEQVVDEESEDEESENEESSDIGEDEDEEDGDNEGDDDEEEDDEDEDEDENDEDEDEDKDDKDNKDDEGQDSDDIDEDSDESVDNEGEIKDEDDKDNEQNEDKSDKTDNSNVNIGVQVDEEGIEKEQETQHCTSDVQTNDSQDVTVNKDYKEFVNLVGFISGLTGNGKENSTSCGKKNSTNEATESIDKTEDPFTVTRTSTISVDVYRTEISDSIEPTLALEQPSSL